MYTLNYLKNQGILEEYLSGTIVDLSLRDDDLLP